MSYFRKLINEAKTKTPAKPAEPAKPAAATPPDKAAEFNQLNNQVQAYQNRQAQLQQQQADKRNPVQAEFNRLQAGASTPREVGDNEVNITPKPGAGEVPKNVPSATVAPETLQQKVHNAPTRIRDYVRKNPVKSGVAGAAGAAAVTGLAAAGIMAAKVKAKRSKWLEGGCASIVNPDEKVACEKYISSRK